MTKSLKEIRTAEPWGHICTQAGPSFRPMHWSHFVARSMPSFFAFSERPGARLG